MSLWVCVWCVCVYAHVCVHKDAETQVTRVVVFM